VSASQAAASETLAPEAAAATTAIVKKRRRWWIVAIFVVAIAAAVAGWYFWFGRNTTAAVHYLTATASTGTIAQSVQVDFTLGSTNGVTTIALGGSSASSSSSSSSTGSSSTASTSATASAGATASLASSRKAAVSSESLTTFAAMSTGGESLADVAAPAITALIPTYGLVGSSVTMVGSGFTGATAVAFNGRAATFTVNSDTQITAIVPSGATSGSVTVTAPGGTATSAASFTVKPTVKPTPSSSSRPSPTPTSSSRSGGGGSFSGSANSGASTTSGSLSSGSTSSGSSSSASSGLSGVVTHIWLRAGATPHTLQRLLTVSGTQVYAFVSPTPLWKNLSTDLATGSQRANVAALQRALKKGGYYTGTINGDFTSATATAYEAWQADHGMTKTGVVSVTRFVWIPTGSIITSWSVNPGNRVSSGTALASVVAPNELSATALVSQADIASLKVGQKAQMTIDGYTSDTFTGTVSYISSQPASSSSASSSSSAQYSITIRPRGLPKVAKSGMTGTLEIVIAQRKNVLLVPTSAVSGTGTTSYLRVMMNGSPQYRQVQTGMATSSYTQITSGLTAGEVVVTGQYTDNATSGSSTGTNGSNGGGLFRQGGGSFPQGGFPQGGLPGGGQ
jgi:macrolide-specific efflux system membrane fusion protein